MENNRIHNEKQEESRRYLIVVDMTKGTLLTVLSVRKRHRGL